MKLCIIVIVIVVFIIVFIGSVLVFVEFKFIDDLVIFNFCVVVVIGNKWKLYE